MLVRRTVILSPLVALLGFVQPSAAADNPPFTINVIAPMTGAGAFIGAGLQRTLHILEGVVNRSRGIRGSSVTFKIFDDQSNPQVDVQLANDLIAQKSPVIIGPSLAATCNAVAAIIKNSTVEYCLSPAVHPSAGSYEYSAGMSTNDILAAAMRYFRLKGLRRIALMTSSDASGQDGERAYDYAAALPENRTVTRVADEHFNLSDVSVAAQIARIKASNPDVIFAWTTGTPFATVLRDINDAGLTMPLATSTGNMSYEQMSQFAQYDTHNLYLVGFRYFDRDDIDRGPLKATVDTFFRAYEAAQIKPDVQPGLSWDVGLLIVSAFRALGTNATAADIKNYIDKQTAFVGIDGIYNFRDIPQRGLDDQAAVVTRWSPKKSTWLVVSRPGGTRR